MSALPDCTCRSGGACPIHPQGEMESPPAARDVFLSLTRKEAQLLRHRCGREQHLVQVAARREQRKLSSVERDNGRRYRRLIEQITQGLVEAGHE